jgi:hypothetical protein
MQEVHEAVSGGQSPSADLSRLVQGEILRDDADLGAHDVLILSKTFEHEDSAGDVNADAIALPVL